MTHQSVDRRTILKTSAAVAAAGPFAGLLAAPASARKPPNAARAGGDPRRARRQGAAAPAAGLLLPVLPRHRGDRHPERRHRPAGSPRRHGRLQGSRRHGRSWCATTRSTTRCRRRSAPGTPYDTRAGGGTTTVHCTPRRPGDQRLHQPQRHDDELLGRDHAVGLVGDLRGDGERAGRRRGLHRRVQRSADQAPRLRLRGAGEPHRSRGPVDAAADQERRAGSPTRPCRSTRRAATSTSPRTTSRFASGFYRYTPPADPSHVGELRDGGWLHMLRVKGVPNAHLEGNQVAGDGVRRRLGRDRGPVRGVLLHPRPACAHLERHRADGRRPAGLGAGGGVLLPAGGAGLQQGRDLLHQHAGRRRGRARHRVRTRSPASATAPARSGPTTRSGRSCAWSTSRPTAPRSTSPTTSPPPTAARWWSARTTPRTTSSAASPPRATCGTSR